MQNFRNVATSGVHGPPYEVHAPPPTGNPGSATVLEFNITNFKPCTPVHWRIQSWHRWNKPPPYGSNYFVFISSNFIDKLVIPFTIKFRNMTFLIVIISHYHNWKTIIFLMMWHVFKYCKKKSHSQKIIWLCFTQLVRLCVNHSVTSRTYL